MVQRTSRTSAKAANKSATKGLVAKAAKYSFGANPPTRRAKAN